MSIRTAAVALGICTSFLVFGLVLGRAGVIPDLLAAVFSAVGFSCGLVLAVLTGLRAAGFGQPRANPVSTDPRVRELIDELALLADASLTRGYLALAEARSGLADGLVRDGCEMVIRASDAREVLRSLSGRAADLVAGDARRRARIGVATSALTGAAALCVFIMLVWLMGAAIEPSGIDAGLGVGLIAAVFGAFGIAVAAPSAVRRLDERGRVRALLAEVAIDGVMAISSGLSGVRVRAILDNLVQNSSDAVLRARPAIAVAA